MKKHAQITGFYLETLLLIVVFISIILVLTQVFGIGRAMSGRAELLTNAVCLAQNAAEAVSASETPEEVAALLNENGNARISEGCVEACYDRDMRPAPEAPALRVLVTWEPAADGMIYSTITVTNGGDPVYSLDTAVYVGEVAA